MKKIMAQIKKLSANCQTLPMLMKIKITDNVLEYTDLKVSIATPLPLDFFLPDGIYDAEEVKLFLESDTNITPCDIDTDEYPRTEKIEKLAGICTQENLASLKPLLKMVSKDELREVITGIGFRNNLAISTNGHILTEISFNPDLNCILSVNTVNMLLAVNWQGSICIHQSDSYISFSDGVTIVTSKLIDCTYPHTKSVWEPVAKRAIAEMAVPFKAMVDLCKKAKAGHKVSKEENLNYITLTYDQGSHTIGYKGVKTRVKCTDAYPGGDSVEIGIDPTYLALMFQPGGDKLNRVLSFRGERTPLVVESGNSKSIIMPMRLKEEDSD